MQIEHRDPEHRLRRRVRYGFSLFFAITVVLVGIAAFQGEGFDWSLGARTRIVRRLLVAQKWTILTLKRKADGSFAVTGYYYGSYSVVSAELKPPSLRSWFKIRVSGDFSASEPILQAERNCLRGLPSCLGAAKLHLNATPPNLARATRFALLGCYLNQPLVCLRAGWFLEPIDPAQAARAFRRACNLGQRDACDGLGEILDGKWGLQYRDAVGACDVFERVWMFRSTRTDAATKVGLCIESGIGRPRDLARSNQILEQTCRLGDEIACAHLSENRILGRGTTRDVARGRAELESRCRSGTVTDCEVLARLLEVGSALPKDFHTAVALRAGTCERGLRNGCLFAQGVYMRGALGIPPDPARAITVARNYCRLYRYQCDEHGVLLPDSAP